MKTYHMAELEKQVEDQAARVAELEADLRDSKQSELLGITVINTHLRTMKEQAEKIRSLRAEFVKISEMCDAELAKEDGWKAEYKTYYKIMERAELILDATK